ncbi:hypothetical protein [Candidatus Borrarchaeum sp.]|uniref:hypothetical protein n=1 Tax=Candidatus Borrarchaeum sp. TaxID=2846742 RepID=UPI00257B9C2A|nr:hypothetical protein [Candidatus Borrarchaeum sp.]
MRILQKKYLISIIGVFLIVLVSSTASNSVADTDWGNLKVNDEIRWDTSPPSPMVLYPSVSDEFKILEIRADDLKVDHTRVGEKNDGTTETIIDEVTYMDSSELWPFIYPVSLIQSNDDVTIKTHKYEGVNYKAAYLEITEYGTVYKYWWDYDTGILFKHTFGESDTLYFHLIYTNADLTERTGRRFCLGTILIAFASVATLVSYNIKLYQKRKDP